VTHGELAEPIELQRESICTQMIEQRVFQAPDHRVVLLDKSKER
jgi:hypothetical protein